MIDPDHSTRSAITVAGICGCSPSNALTLASNGVNDVGRGDRSYLGGRSDANALSTVDLPIPSCLATCRCGTPSATSRLINAQSSTEIIHPICLGGLVFARRYGLVFNRRRHRHPLLVAKALATIDQIGPGRVSLGVGVGWMREEFEALGQDFSVRGRRTDEAIEVMRRAWSPYPTEFHGQHFDFDRIVMKPAPRSPIPIYIGGGSQAAVERAARLGDGFIPPADRTPLTEWIQRVRLARIEAGRESIPFSIIASGLHLRKPSELRELGEFAISAVRLDPVSAYAERREVPPNELTRQERLDSLAWFADSVVDPVRS